MRLLRALFHPQSIKTRVTFFLMISFLISFWSFSFYASTLLRYDMQNILQTQQFSTASIVAKQLDQEIQTRLDALKNVANDASDAFLKGPDAMQAFLNERSTIKSLFNTALFVVDTKGLAIASVPIPLGITGGTYNERDYVQKALSGKSAVGKVVIGKRLQKPTVSLAAPIFSKNKEPIGALVGTIGLGDSNFDRVAQQGYGKEGNYFIVSAEHRLIITSSDKNRIMTELPPKGVAPAIDRFIDGYEGSAIYTNASGQEILLSAKRIPSANWGIAISIPTQEIFAPIQTMQQRIVLATLLMTLFIGTLFWSLMHRQLLPIFDAIKSLDAMTGKEHLQPLPVSRNDEIGKLINSFNTLLTTINEQKNQLESIAYYDALTHLPNRHLVIQTLQDKIEKAEAFTVLLLDLDEFKTINDHFGHPIGDCLLVAVAQKLQQHLTSHDTLSRLSGDEFVIILSNATDNQKILESLLEAFATSFALEGGIELFISASIGVSSFPQANTLEADQLLRQADQAMYQAKLGGKNRYHFFDVQHDYSMRRHHESIENIRKALRENELILHYQPKVNMRTGQLLGVEALIRWQHPQKGCLPPSAFLSFIEEHPLGIEVGTWVIYTALAQIEAWKMMGLDIHISVNISAKQLQDTSFVQTLKLALAHFPSIDPSFLELEILETSALHDLPSISHLMHACHDLDVSFALDDFGTGYSSLTYLKALPCKTLKIDKSFVRDMLEDPDDLSILEGVIGLATAFRRHVIAEGVEDIEHGKILIQLGCEYAQGYAIARPMPPQELPQWLHTWHPPLIWQQTLLAPRDDYPLIFASVEHRAWVINMKQYLNDTHSAIPIIDKKECRFGKWIEYDGIKRYTFEQLKPIDALHVEIHELGYELIRLKQEGDYQKIGLLIEKLHILRDTLLDKLEALMNRNETSA
jgi:diguanylate cyclase (GGDEF)-like protein